jgi:hypothetical protein
MNIDKKHWPTDGAELVQSGDRVRFLGDDGEWGEWASADHLAGSRADSFAKWYGMGIQFCRPAKPVVEPAPEQPPATTPDRGSKYHRTLTQTLPGDTHGLSVTVDVYDVLQAFGVSCPAVQHAVKKLLCAGLRGAKSAEQDISEAANSCRRAIELLGCDL